MNAKRKLWLDVVLFAGFLAAFFLDLTGVIVHQWLGIAVGLFSAYHLATHWSWVTSVTRRFFGRTSPQARRYYLVDVAVLAGFAGILFTGLVISTWLDLALVDYSAWYTFHVLFSIGALLALTFKLALHWRWIISAVHSVFARAPRLQKLPNAAQPAAAGRLFNRREFLKVMGVVGMSSLFALGKSVESLQVGQAAASEAPVTSSTVAVVTQSGASSGSAASSSTTCRVRCNKGCSFPGKCRKYVDANKNDRCDLGECI